MESRGCAGPGPPHALAPPAAGAGRRSRLAWLAAASLLIIAGVLALYVLGPRGARLRSLLGAGSPHITSIAVLPLDNLSGDPGQEYFADGMTEELVTALGKIRALRVISRRSVMRYKGTRKPVPQIVRELNVDALIEGTVTQLNGRARVTANLIHGPTDRHLWAESYERGMGDLISLQREVAREVATQVRASVSREELARLAQSRPLDPRAYELYLKGQFHYYKWSAPEFAKAVTYYEQAVALDPSFAEAHLGLAKTYGWQWMKKVLSPQEAYPKFAASLKRAMEIDPNLPEAHYVLAVSAWFFYWNWAQAEKEFKLALALNPNFEEARFEYAWFLSAMGKDEEAILHARRAVEGDPLSFSANIALGAIYDNARQLDQALRQILKTIELDPNDPIGYEFLAVTYAKLGLHDEAVRAHQKQLALNGAQPRDIEAAWEAYRSSGREGFLRWRLARTRHSYDAAAIQAQLGMNDEAMANLEKCYREHWWAMVQLKKYSKWDPLRTDPRFQDLLRRMSFPR